MESRKNLRAFFQSGKPEDDYIRKYKENSVFFNSLLNGRKPEDLEFVIPIKLYYYADPLFRKGEYRRALEITEQIESDLLFMKSNNNLHKQYTEGVLFLKGACLSRLKKYHESNLVFREIIKSNPTNDKFKEWYKTNLKYELERMLYALCYLGLAVYLVSTILEFFNIRSRNILFNTIGFVLALGALISSYVWKMIIDKKEIVFK